MATVTKSEELKRRLARIFYERGELERMIRNNREALQSLVTDTVESASTGTLRKRHRRNVPLTNTGLSKLVDELAPKLKQPQQQEEEEPEMMTYITCGAAQLRPFSGKSKDHQGIVDFLETIENQAEVECRQDEGAKEKLQLHLFRTHLRGDAKSMLDLLTPAEKDDWRQVKAIYIAKYKNERDQRAKQKAREAVVSFRQRSDESLKAYGERAVKLRQLLDTTDEGFLVCKFLRRMRNKAIGQMLALGDEDLSKVTVGQLNQKIRNLAGAGDESDSEDEDTEESDDKSGGESSHNEDYRRRKKRKSKKKVEGKALRRAQKAISEMEEKIKMLTAGNSKIETFAVQQVPQLSYQMQNTSWQALKHPGAPYTCYSCGMTGHMARFCPDKTSGRATRNTAGTTILFPGDNGLQRMIWVDYPPNRLAPGYYPVEPLPQGENRHRTPHNRFQANSSNENKEPASAGRVTEIKEVT